MKKNENKTICNRSLVVLLVIAMIASVAAGCNKPGTENTVSSAPTSEEESDVVSAEVSEVASEDPSEVVSESECEEPEIVDGVQMVYYETYEELLEYIDTIDETVVVVYSFSHPEKGQAILYDGAHYTIEDHFAATVKSPETIAKITSTQESLSILDYDIEGIHEWDIRLYEAGTDIEVPLTITYEDGTEETITVYLTKDWKYMGEK